MTPELASTLSLAEQHEWFRKATSRRSLLRGGLVGAGALAAGPALLGGTATAAGSAPALATSYEYAPGSSVIPFGRHIAYGADPTTEMAVAWQVPSAVRNPFIRVGSSPWNLGERIEAEVRALSTPRTDVVSIDNVAIDAPTTIEQYYLHATIRHLTPGQTYYYAVGHDGFDVSAKTLATTLGNFTTATNQREPFTFTAFGDQGVTYDAVATGNLVMAQNPAFHLVAGDICYAEAHGSGLITDAYDARVWDAYFNQIAPAASSVPWLVGVGNHEMEAWYSPDGYGGMFARFDFPQPQTAYNAFTYGNVAVISLDANDLSYEMPANRGYTGGAQTAWLEQQLAAFRASKSIDFIVVYFHHPAYSTSSGNGSEGGVREEWVPLFDKYGVDLAINGHNHVYERTDPIRGGAATGTAPVGATVNQATAGTTYIVVGGAGESIHPFSAADSYEGAVDDITGISSYINETSGKVTETVNWSRVRYSGYCILRVDSLPAKRGGTSTLVVRGLNEQGDEIDRVVLARQAG
jgi:hypothetical protein